MTRFPSILARIRTLLHGSDRKRAVADERTATRKYLAEAKGLDRRLQEAFSAHADSAIDLGTAVEFQWKVRFPAKAFGAHTVIFGPSGSGKTRFVVLLLKGLFEAGFRRAVLLDPKNETTDLTRVAIVTVGRKLSPKERRALYESVVQVDLFGTTSLPRLNILAPQAGMDAETQAYEVAGLLTIELDQSVGVRQEAILHRTIECFIWAKLPLTVLPLVFEAPVLLERLAETHGHAELFRATAARLKRESKERVLGLQSRVERVLRLRATRLAFSAPDCLDAGCLLDLLALVSLAPPQDAADIARMLAGLLWILLSQAIRQRPNGSPRSHLVIDEFPTFLAGGGGRMADGVEDILRLARSKGVFLTALSQDLVSIAKISSSLPEVLRNNIHLFSIFRSVADSAFDFMLPVTGRRPKPKAAPWEEERGGFLERGVELTHLRSILARLPDRELFLADRRTGLPGVHMRTADLHLEATEDELGELDTISRSHPMLAPVSVLERGYDETMRRMHLLLGDAERRHATPEERGPVRRARGRLDIG